MPEPVERIIGRDAARGAEIIAAGRRPRDFVTTLAEARFGMTPPRYRRVNVDEQLDRLHDPVYFVLRRDGRAVGTYCIDRQTLQLGDTRIDAAYRGLLSIREDEQRSGLGRWLVDSALGWLRDHRTAALCYGCIDARNERALRLLAREGGVPLGELDFYTLYRQFPRRRVALEQIGAESHAEVEALLSESASPSELTDRVLPRGGAYHVVRDAGEVRAGAHVSLTRVDLERLRGVSGFVVERLMPLFPPGRRRFDPRNFAYLRLNHLYAPARHAEAWPAFIESLLAGHGVHFAGLVLDPRSATFATLQRAGLPGAIARRTAQRLRVISAGVEPDPGLLERIRAAPLSISARDL
jgi:GNAT superfamily N-acetyltransferase